MDELDLKAAHAHCFENEAEVTSSSQCGCFYCLSIYSAGNVVEWVDDKTARTAICPECGIDSVIGDKSGLPVWDTAFLTAMFDRWFS